MRIAVDLDNVVFEWLEAFTEYTNIRFGHSDDHYGFKQWDYWQQDGVELTEDEFMTAFDDFSRYRMWQSIELSPFAREALCSIDSMGHQIFYLTSRPRSESMATVKSIIHNGLPFHGILFLDEKAEIAEALDIGVGIDDNIKQLDAYVEHNICPVVYRRSNNMHWEVPDFGFEVNNLMEFVNVIHLLSP